MKAIRIAALIMLSCISRLSAQDDDLDIQTPCDSLEYGFGIEAGIRPVNYSGNESIRFILRCDDPIRWKIQPDTVFGSDCSVLSMKAGDSYFTGETMLEIIGIHKDDSVKKTISIKIFGDHERPSFNTEKSYLSQSVAYLGDLYPEYLMQLNEIDTSSMFCYRPFPSFDIVNHSVLLSNAWRITVLEHVMVPPYDWKKVFVWNPRYNLYFGVEIDTHGVLTLIPCQVHYYFSKLNYSPLEITLSNSRIIEDNQVNALIGSLSTVDNFDTLSYTYRIVNGNGPFTISNGNELRANAVFNYESDSIYNIDILSENEFGYGLVHPFNITVIKNTASGIHGIINNTDSYYIQHDKIYFNRKYKVIEAYDLSGRMIRTVSNSSCMNLEDLQGHIAIIVLFDFPSIRTIKILF
jgi:hypothetical protein